VRNVITDQRELVGSIFKAVNLSINSPYPFGMDQPGRSVKAAGTSGYEYGYNGKPKDTDEDLVN
jgi:hypothetical protein